jgi:hypothetical protein
MDIEKEQFRNCTVSFRTTSQHKLQLSRLAEASNLSTSEYLLHLCSRYAQPVEKFSGELREVRECKDQIKQLERGKRQLELYLKNADERVAIEQSIALRHTEQSSALEFENRKLHAELTLFQNMLGNREAIEELTLDIQCEEEHQEVIMPTSKPNGGGEAIMFGAIGFLVLIMGGSFKK